MPESEVSDVDEERPVSPTESDPILEKKKKAVEKAEQNLRTAQAKLKSLEEKATVAEQNVEVLCRLEPAVLAMHAPALLAKLDDTDSDVRKAACEVVDKLEPAVLATHAPALLTQLESLRLLERRGDLSGVPSMMSVHPGMMCDRSRMYPIVGNRYHLACRAQL